MLRKPGGGCVGWLPSGKVRWLVVENYEKARSSPPKFPPIRRARIY